MTCSQRYLIAAGTETEFSFLCKADSPNFYGFDVVFLCVFFFPSSFLYLFFRNKTNIWLREGVIASYPGF